MQNKIKEIETQLQYNEKIKMPKSKKYSQELKNKIAQHNSNIIHDKKYTIIGDYINSSDKMKIKCKSHGIFEQSYNNHTAGAGCPKCDTESKTKTKEVIQNKIKIIENQLLIKEKIRMVIGNKYPQDLKNRIAQHNSNITHDKKYTIISDYISNYAKLKINCPKHGMFIQSLNHHLEGRECPSCYVANFNNLPAQLYILKNELDQFKIGISIDTKRRINNLSNDSPFIKITQMIEYNFASFHRARKYESKIHQELKEYNIVFNEKFDGYTEWFNCSFEQAIEVVNKYYKGYSLLEDAL